MKINDLDELKKLAHKISPNELLDYSSYFRYLGGVKLALGNVTESVFLNKYNKN